MFYTEEEWKKYFDIVSDDAGYKIYDYDNEKLLDKLYMSYEGALIEINKRLMKKEKQYLEDRFGQE